MRRTTKLMACLLLACATLTARALDRTFLEGNDVTVDKLTSLLALDVSKMITQSSLDNNGLMASVGVRRNQNLLHGMTFTHDGVTGNLLERTGMFSYGEEFAYDDLDRLTSYTGQGGTKYITYEDNGNIQSHTDLGDYEYSQVKPHAVETVGSLLPGVQSADGSTFTYNGFGKVSSINFSGMSQMSWRRLDFSYGPDRERWKTVRTMRGGLIPGPITTLAIPESSVNYVHTTNLYAGDYERIDGTSYYYLDGGVIYVKPATSAGQAYYALTDHLGSYVRLYTMAGDSVLIASYDPWGNRTTTKNTLKFFDERSDRGRYHRGFSGHEHLTTYGVINMRSAQRDALLAKNGRMYDPTVGRFLAPDRSAEGRLQGKNFVQMPDFSQSFNRYSYCLNNPLKYVDRDRELFGWLLHAFTETVGNVFKHGLNFSQYNYKKTVNFWRLDTYIFKGGFGQVLKKLTWNLPNTLIGNYAGEFLNTIGMVDKVTTLDGGIALSGVTGNRESAFTIGAYIFGPKNFEADWRDELFVHEYGHFLQSLDWGALYLPVIGITSGLSSWLGFGATTDDKHMHRWFEIDASRRGANHFDKYYGSGADGYSKGEPNYFDFSSFVTGNNAPYINPRTGKFSGNAPNPISGQRNSWADILIPFFSISIITGLGIVLL